MLNCLHSIGVDLSYMVQKHASIPDAMSTTRYGSKVQDNVVVVSNVSGQLELMHWLPSFCSSSLALTASRPLPCCRPELLLLLCDRLDTSAQSTQQD